MRHRGLTVSSRVLTLGLATVVLSAALTACGGGSSGSSTKQSTTSTVSAGSHVIPPGELGTYARPNTPEGTSRALTLSADGRYAQTIVGSAPNGIHGVWSLRNGRITFTETGGSDAACLGQQGTYSWSYANKTLSLTVVSDPCQPRRSDFPIAAFRQQP